MNTSDHLLAVDNLRVAYPTDDGLVEAVRGISFRLGRERLGIVGESGSGKSTVGRALLRLLPGARISADRIDLAGIDLLHATERDMLELRGRRLSMILQDPKFSLNPVHRVGDQVAEAYLAHKHVSHAEARARTLDMLQAVQIREPEKVYRLYPHEVSGGMGQRIMIAMMLILDPDLVVADEPTSALDVTVRIEVLKLLDSLVQSRGGGLIMISHDLNLVRHFCDRVLIMYAGRIVEELDASGLAHAKHPYTLGLLAAQPRIGGARGPLPVLSRDPAWLEQGSRL